MQEELQKLHLKFKTDGERWSLLVPHPVTALGLPHACRSASNPTAGRGKLAKFAATSIRGLTVAIVWAHSQLDT
jgi:hypothetical protein